MANDVIEPQLRCLHGKLSTSREDYRMIHHTLGLIAAMTLLSATNAMASTFPPGVPQLDRNREITMALSAAPQELQPDAGVYVLERTGYVLARPSRNGFNCLVERDIQVTAPVCYDAEGSRTSLLASLERARIMMRGVDSASIDRMIDAEYQAGRLRAPTKPGIAYMLSHDFVRLDSKTGAAKILFPPHVMVYAPYLRNEDIGVSKAFVRSTTHVWVEAEGKPDACLVFTIAR